MGKKIILCVALFSCLLLLMACSSKNSELIGKWYYSDADLLYEFKSNGEGTLTTRGVEYSIEYEVGDGKITIIAVDGSGSTVSETYGYEIVNKESLVLNDSGAEAVFVKQD